MRLPQRIVDKLERLAVRTMLSRDADFTIIRDGEPYMRRWHLYRNKKLGCAYVHLFVGDDPDPLHDHPWFSVSVLLRGQYREDSDTRDARGQVINRRIVRERGAVTFRGPWRAHRINLLSEEALTIFITGPVMKKWGFYCGSFWSDKPRWVEHKHDNAEACEQDD